ncbi:MAG: twin-arginine translocase subunit TatC, partial [Desulfovibrionaceae bacterium]
MTSPDDKTPDGLEPAAVPAVKDDGEVVLPDAGETLPESPEPESESDADSESESVEDKKAGRMSLMDHLLELRKRLTRCLLAVLVGFLACYGFAQRMFEILMEPMRQALTKIHETTHVLSPDFFDQLKPALTEALKGQNFPYLDQIAPFVDALKEATVKVVVEQGHFIYTYPPEAFFAYVKVAFVAGFFLVSP